MASSSTVESLGWDFNSFFRAEYPEKDDNPSGRIRRSPGRRVYVCLHCPARWSNGWKGNCLGHARSRHRELIRANELSQHSTQPLDSLATFKPFDSALRSVFNAQRYSGAIVELLTRHRIPFSSVAWNAMKSLALACNPAIEDCLITSRDRALNLVKANYEMYTTKLRALIQHSESMVHISTDLWTTPHRHALLAVCAQWVDRDFKLRKALLGLPECQFSHSGGTRQP